MNFGILLIFVFWHHHVSAKVRVTIPESVTRHNLPFWDIDDSTGERIGFFIDVTEALFKAMNQSFTYVTNASSISYSELGYVIMHCTIQSTLSFIVQDVALNKTDILIGDATIQAHRLKLVDFSVPLQTADLIVVMRKKETKEKNIFTFLKPFSDTVWIYISFVIFIGIYELIVVPVITLR